MKKYSSLVLGGIIVGVCAIFGVLAWEYTRSTIPLRSSNESVTPLLTANTDPTPGIKVAFLGDQGITQNSKYVLELIRNEEAELIVHAGDFDYTDNPNAWDKQLSDVLGAAYPQIAVLGNHDLTQKEEYEKKIRERIALNPHVSCTGTLGEKSTCIYQNLRIISVAPGLIPDDYTAYITSSLQNASEEWRICSWHVTQQRFQVGLKGDEAGDGVYEACRSAGALIVTGHEHSYHRTYLLDALVPPHIATTSSRMMLVPGTTLIAVSGIGGQSIRPQETTAPWWATVYTASQHGTYGALFCTFNYNNDPRVTHCYFKDIQGNVPDQFDLVRPEV